MKKLSYLLFAVLFIMANNVFVSCTDDENALEPTVSVKATYAAKSNEVIYNGDVLEADEGMIITFKITYSMGTNKLKEVRMSSEIDGKNRPVLDSLDLDKGIFNKGAKSIDFTWETNFGKSDEKIKFYAVDTKGLECELNVTIKSKVYIPEDPEDEFRTLPITLLGGQQNATAGSFYSVSLGKVFTVSTATNDPGIIDFAYFHGDLNKATIAAPDDSDAQTISYGSTKMSSWSITNSTKFHVLSGVDGSKPANWWNDNIDKATTNTKASQLAAGQVVIFKTQRGTKGAFVVDEISGTKSGYIKILLIEKIKN